MTHAEDIARGDAEIAALVAKLDTVPGTRCAVCRLPVCGHSDAEYAGVVCLKADHQLHAESDKA
ncbi:hypothetical protein [Sphingomonas sp. PAMC 26621]|uniref:hypothetical protein n=1 Tax=Sphingomonas sp. PAMC 26621 TaxID=1112213 RepID=UPI00028A0EDB|nr:hypothetical protein [Sphingomonas sp. PAMC 26621]